MQLELRFNLDKLGFGFKNLENSGAQFCDVEWQDLLALIHLKIYIIHFIHLNFFIFSSFGHNHETGTPDIFLVLGFFLHHKERN